MNDNNYIYRVPVNKKSAKKEIKNDYLKVQNYNKPIYI